MQSLERIRYYFPECLVINWRRKWQPTPVFLTGEPHGQRSLVCCCPWGHTESDMTQATTEAITMHACIGEGNGIPLQYSCLENTRDRGAWWAAIYGVAQSSWTRLKRHSSSSSDKFLYFQSLPSSSM